MVNPYSHKLILETLSKTAVSPDDIAVLLSPKDYFKQLLALIDAATARIYLTVLYLENDEAGRLIIAHLIAAKQKKPQLEIKIFVDYHRARRVPNTQKNARCNADFYREIDINYPDFIQIYGVAVKRREVFGVLHLKGIVIDDTLFYTGASINNVYLHYQERYRYDRYWIIKSEKLCDSFVGYLNHAFICNEGVYQFNRHPFALDNTFRRKIAAQYKRLKKERYQRDNENEPGHLTVAPLIGIGNRNNQLNKIIHQLMLQTKQRVVLYTPYFNLPEILKRDVALLWRRQTKVEIVVGDKRANDFFVPETQPFTKIGLIPYLYEMNLLKFIKYHQKAVDSGLLSVRLWRHDAHSFHLKGLRVDNRYHLLTGNNLNPRAWRLDFENGLLIDDRDKQLMDLVEQEHQQIIQHTRIIKNWQQIETQNDYPLIVKKWLTRLRWSNLDKLLKQYM